MAIDVDGAFSRGDLPRQLQELTERVEELETARTLESASIGSGGLAVKGGAIVIYNADGVEQMRLSTDGLTMEGLLAVIGAISVSGGGDITVQDGGAFEALDGSQIRARYADGSTAVLWGSLVEIATGDPSGHGILIQDDEAGNGEDIFRAKRDETGELQVYVGSIDGMGNARPVDEFITESLDTKIRSYGGADAFFTVFGGGDAAIAASDGGDARMSVFDTGGAVRLANEDFVVITAYEVDTQTANCHLTEEGQIIRTSSARRYKADIADAQIDPDAVLRLRPRTWLPSSERTGSTGMPPGERKDGAAPGRERPARKAATRAKPQARQVGFVAEELDDIGLGQFVEHTADGQAESIAYDRLTAALVSLCQRQQQQIDTLTQRIDALSQPASS